MPVTFKLTMAGLGIGLTAAAAVLTYIVTKDPTLSGLAGVIGAAISSGLHYVESQPPDAPVATVTK